MAYLVLHHDLISIFKIGKTKERIKTVLGNLHAYEEQNLVFSITDQQFDELNLATKQFSSVSNNSVVLQDRTVHPLMYTDTEANLNSNMNGIIESINHTLQNGNFSNEANFKTELENYKAFLENFDTSTVPFPMTSTIEKYLADNSLITPINPLQF